MQEEGRKRVVIEHLKPAIDGGCFPIKRVVGEKVVVTADIFADGHDVISARLLYRRRQEGGWEEAPMRFLENDRWEGEFTPGAIGLYDYTVEGWIDHFKTWQRSLKKKLEAGQDLEADLLIGAGYVEETAERASGEDRRKLTHFADVLKKGKGREEYLNAEKYEIKRWNWNRPGNLRDFETRVNQIRKENPALQATQNLRFLRSG